MKKLKKISLSDVKVMDAQEMKMILGGQFVQDITCRVAGGSGVFGGWIKQLSDFFDQFFEKK